MCAICMRTPCDPRCPNAPDPPAVYTCKHCGEPIVPGDEYMEVDGDYYHLEDCAGDAALDILKDRFGARTGVAEVDRWYRHWGLPEYIRIRKELREAVTSVSYSVKMLEKSVQAIYGMKNLQELLTTDEGEDVVLRRLRVIDMARNFLNSIAIDSDGETYDFKSMTLSGVKDIVETTFATISAVSNVPQTVLFGRSPAGENATGDGDLENWYSYVQRIWKVDVKSNLKYLVDIIIKAGMAQGYITEDPKPKIEMNPLWSLSETEQATVDQTKAATEQTKATTLQLYVDMQAIGPDEVRAALKKEGTLDISSMLDDLPEDETWGLGEEIEGAPTDPFQTPQGRLTEAQGTSQTVPGDNSLPQEENADTGDLTGQGPGTKITGVWSFRLPSF